MKSNTIAAIATAMTNSGIGIIRLSGEESIIIIDKIFRSKSGSKKLSKVKSHTVHYGYIYDGEKILDEVLVLVMRAPHSYTTEDTIEIDCHGGTLVMTKILELVIKKGARAADPGEFTKRAFLNGRIDLSQAESVIDIINAKNEFALDTSMKQLQGNIFDKISQLRSKILYEVAYIESYLDDPEHIEIDGYAKKLFETIISLINEIQKILQRSKNGHLLKEGIQTVIIGKPNVGKSSLMNQLVGRERAIVTDIAGTTRDLLEEDINLNGIILNLIDTAGIRNTDNIVEKIGVDKAKESLFFADLVLHVVDGSTELDEEDIEILNLSNNEKVIIIINKSDLPQKNIYEQLKKLTKHDIIKMSAKNGDGINQLQQIITHLFFYGEVTYNDEVFITNIRHKSLLEESQFSLNMVLKSIEDQMPEDFFTIDLMNAYELLGSIIGESVNDDLVNKIFSEFCTGK